MRVLTVNDITLSGALKWVSTGYVGTKLWSTPSSDNPQSPPVCSTGSERDAASINCHERDMANASSFFFVEALLNVFLLKDRTSSILAAVTATQRS